MKVSIRGSAGAIHLPADFPTKPDELEVDRLMRALSEVLDEGWGAVKISGYWLIGRTDVNEQGWQPTYGHRPGEQSRKFVNALAIGTGRAVVSIVPART